MCVLLLCFLGHITVPNNSEDLPSLQGRLHHVFQQQPMLSDLPQYPTSSLWSSLPWLQAPSVHKQPQKMAMTTPRKFVQPSIFSHLSLMATLNTYGVHNIILLPSVIFLVTPTLVDNLKEIACSTKNLIALDIEVTVLLFRLKNFLNYWFFFCGQLNRLW